MFFILALILIFFSTSQEIGWEERLRYDLSLFSVECDVNS